MKLWKQQWVFAAWIVGLAGMSSPLGMPNASGQTSTVSSQNASSKNGAATDAARTPIEHFLTLLSSNPTQGHQSLRTIAQSWRTDDVGMLIEAARFTRNRTMTPAILGVLEAGTGENFGSDFDAWYRWIWNQNVDLHPNYAAFKRALYRQIDPRFAEYFSDQQPAKIRLDEIRWGGVRRDGIPPLSNPETIPASQATYLNDSDVVFGVSLGGKNRAYPKRILAWHEMVKDRVGGLSINGVYCTLCGSMIVYKTELDGKHYELGTSGFLYRSNKLMYDHETKSMWSTLQGRPVVGPLVDQGIQLEPLYVVTTTWGQWKADHPDTDVLSLRTGHRRDYGEGVAYRDYFSTDKLMFTVPMLDKRLKNKDEVLIVRDEGVEPIAIAAEFLNRQPLYQDQIGDTPFVVVTDASGANRVYESLDLTFQKASGAKRLQSDNGIQWTVTEDALVADQAVTIAGESVDRLQRISAHRAFWFGWFADHPDVRLIQ